jgi:uncharacterized repeat protein (TIGR03803 family)
MNKKIILILVTFFLVAINAEAVSFTTLKSFTSVNAPSWTNSDGACPRCLVVSGNTLYGTAGYGTGGNGTVFKINTDGTGFTNLYSFTPTSGSAYTNSDGASPGGVLLSGNVLYGVTRVGGSGGNGTIFRVTTDGTGFTNLHNFSNNDGYIPQAVLVLSGGILYGTAGRGGSYDDGTVFSMNTDGTDFKVLKQFPATKLDPAIGFYAYTNSDGAHPFGGVVLSSNILYGTTQSGGSGSFGTVFAVNTDGTGFTNLHTFSGGSDLGASYVGLTLSGNKLYGTTAGPGIGVGFGTVFAMNTDGTSFTNLHSFNLSDGALPRAVLVLSGNTLFGTTEDGGSAAGNGTVFKVNTDGTGFTNLYSFTPTSGSAYTNSDGVTPGSFVLSGNNLYGTTQFGGSGGSGTIFALTDLPVSISLNIQLNGGAVVLTWNDPAFSLQTATNVTGVYSNVSVATNPYTNTINGSQQFFRLQAN